MAVQEKFHRALMAVLDLYKAAEAAGDRRMIECANAAVVALMGEARTAEKETDRPPERFDRTIAGVGP